LLSEGKRRGRAYRSCGAQSLVEPCLAGDEVAEEEKEEEKEEEEEEV